ncbi:hypothetical protein SPAR89_0329 [Streptococcus pneumoniae GA47210]|nr:hypothetical protein SPAR89_0329 [Streptococcus pneumoniae GA47210]
MVTGVSKLCMGIVLHFLRVGGLIGKDRSLICFNLKGMP